MKLTQLKYVVTAAEEGSFTKAAELLYVTQSTLSLQIAALEKEIGVPLFFRHNHNVSLTPAGKDFVRQAQGILNAEQALIQTMNNYRNFNTGMLRIGVPYTFGYLPQSKQLYDVMNVHPKIESQLILDGSSSLLRKLTLGEIDMAILTDGKLAPSQDVKLFELDQCVMFAAISPDSSLYDRKKINFTDLDGEKIQMPPKSSPFRAELMSLMQRYSIKPSVFSDARGSLDIAIHLSSTGYGITFCTKWVADNFKHVKCRFIPIEPYIERSIYLAVMKDAVDYPINKIVIDHLLACSSLQSGKM